MITSVVPREPTPEWLGTHRRHLPAIQYPSALLEVYAALMCYLLKVKVNHMFNSYLCCFFKFLKAFHSHNSLWNQTRNKEATSADIGFYIDFANGENFEVQKGHITSMLG